ncbi:FG-GAP-like repeat-containing protein [Opitutus terrae]|uniref:ASPIC/UnbV domain protein n=1 Tax=Opitutus terrae (strain DSM 11246 / JCM 15787 / PB90-1) TaxID=452637 RepID=B1ZT59_OPITP|nr:FG-GAP-like repeat-containing protein [Opitutus terrae]ACB76513.1 ASPIC/UnbV domain protein [Opitutus terrae PB90-1]
MPSPRFVCLIAVLLLLSAADGAASADLTRTPFASPSQRSGQSLFAPLSPTLTGLAVDNRYNDPRMWGSRYRPFMGGAMGSGVAVGDFDRDGKVDLYVSTKTQPGRLFRNLGGWKFEDVTDRAGVAEQVSTLDWLKGALSSDRESTWHQGAVFADVNNDGWLDLFVCRLGAPNLLYINHGDGTFSEEAELRGLAIVDGSVVGAFADYDRDGWLDVMILTNLLEGTEPLGRPDRLFRNTGKGFFVETTATAGVGAKTFGHAATWLDYDGDRWPDLYLSNDFSGADLFYHNNGDGTFTNVLDAVVPHTPYSSMGADTADINNDGHFDLLIADMATTSREKDRRGLAASRNDVLQTVTTERTAPQYMRSALLLNSGRGNFAEVACWAGVEATDWTWSPRFEDFDNDGWTDLHVTNGMVREANNTDLLAGMMRALSDMQRISVMKKAPPLNEPNLAFRNRHGEGFEPVTDEWGLGEVGVSFGSATADFDGDGDLDLVYLNYDGGLSVFRNDSIGPHALQVRLRGTTSNRDGVGAIVRIETGSGPQIRAMTVARGYASGSELVAHFGLGSDTRVDQLRIDWPSGITQVFDHLEAGYAYLITEAGTVAPAGAVSPPPLFQPGAETAGLVLNDASPLAIPDKEQWFIPFRTDRRGPGVVVSDLDGDGDDDVYLTATPGSPGRVLRRAANRLVEEPARGVAAGGVEEGPALFLDVDQNGTRDLLVTRASANTVAWPDAFRPVIYANDGTGNFTPTDWLPELSLNVGAVTAADIDGDGDLDLFLGGRSVPGRYPETPQSVLLRNDRGRFTDISGGSAGVGAVGLVKSALFCDVDLDGRPDLLFALEWDTVRYFHNDGSGHFSDRTAQAGFASGGRGWWNSIVTADLNGDGRPDFVAGNLGLNTTYEASAKHPATLFYGDFAQNGTKLIAEAVYDGDELYPLRPRADLAARLPFIPRRYPKNDDFARATMAAVFGDQIVAAAEVRRADNFSSGAFLSQPDGTYRFSPLPRIAQLGPIQGIVATDLDGDGLVDVCAVQNSDAAVPRFDGGLGIFLKGKGDGRLEALAPARSGVVVPGNARALVLLDAHGSGRPDLFITRHGGPTQLLTNQSVQPRWLTVRLQGSQANPDAVGARVELVYAHLPPAHYQITVGGGWFSQSAPGLFAAIPPGDSLVEAIVTWPDGHRSRHSSPPEQGPWILQR